MNHLKHKYKSTFILALIFLVLFASWISLVVTHSFIINNLDSFFIKIICNTNPHNIAFAKMFTVLGNTSTITTITVILFLILLIAKKNLSASFLAIVMILANLSNLILKNIVQRPRPQVKHLVYASGYSFPSGHSVGSAALCGVLIIFTLYLIKKRWLKILLIIILLSFPILIGYTRIFLHVHYPSDVMGGFIEACSYLFLTLAIYKYLEYKKDLEINF
ncbi:phosphatase PAP2 family protein [Lactobacillus hominis]|uniref:phosphatase PAP2 family protein n=1 Tax=Lactobacillus hominis TaxID=1203033 RepID=UPI0023F17227|nr:phosphatase PAP2 family protein [Lactobacillus hominis]